ncbi:hypothetical protein V8E51_007440 [Hyaloscypha variabilis]|jgi:hypothetical protein
MKLRDERLASPSSILVAAVLSPSETFSPTILSFLPKIVRSLICQVIENTKNTGDDILKSIRFVPGTVFEALLKHRHGACVYQLRRILNVFTDGGVLRAVRSLRVAAAPDSRILIIEVITGDRNVLTVWHGHFPDAYWQ